MGLDGRLRSRHSPPVRGQAGLSFQQYFPDRLSVRGRKARERSAAILLPKDLPQALVDADSGRRRQIVESLGIDQVTARISKYTPRQIELPKRPAALVIRSLLREFLGETRRAGNAPLEGRLIAEQHVPH